MLSSDKNVETIAELAGVVKHYLGLQKEFLKYDIIEKVVRLLTAAALALLFFLITIAVMMFLSFAIAYWLSAYVGLPKAFLLIAGIHFVLLVLFIYFRKSWIEKPLVRFLVNLLFQ